MILWYMLCLVLAFDGTRLLFYKIRFGRRRRHCRVQRKHYYYIRIIGSAFVQLECALAGKSKCPEDSPDVYRKHERSDLVLY